VQPLHLHLLGLLHALGRSRSTDSRQKEPLSNNGEKQQAGGQKRIWRGFARRPARRLALTCCTARVLFRFTTAVALGSGGF
jgi:hypothetical protein